MKAVIFGGLAVALAAAMYLRPAGHDYDGIILQRPDAVQAALAETLDPANSGYSLKEMYGEAGELQIDRSDPYAIHARFLLDGKQASAVILHFEPANGGMATHVTGDLDIDPAMLAAGQRRMGNQNDIDQTPVYLYRRGFRETLQNLAGQLDDDQKIAGQPLNFTLAQRTVALLK
jgi:hypothetical protein